MSLIKSLFNYFLKIYNLLFFHQNIKYYNIYFLSFNFYNKNECIKIKLQNSTNGNFNNYQVCSNDSYNNLEKSNLKINFEILDNKLNNNVIKSQKNIIKIKEKNNIYSNNGSKLNNVIEKNKKKNKEYNL